MTSTSVELLHHSPLKILKSALEKPYKTEMKDRENQWKKVAKTVLIMRKHESVGEHMYFHFNISMSRYALQELVRHRIASLTVQSTRFCLIKLLCDSQNLKNLVILSPQLPESAKQKVYQSLEDIKDTINILREQGNLTNAQTMDIVKDMLPESFKTEFLWTINWRSLCNFLKLRLGDKDNKPHWQINEIAQKIMRELKKTETWFMFQHLETL